MLRERERKRKRERERMRERMRGRERVEKEERTVRKIEGDQGRQGGGVRECESEQERDGRE